TRPGTAFAYKMPWTNVDVNGGRISYGSNHHHRIDMADGNLSFLVAESPSACPSSDKVSILSSSLPDGNKQSRPQRAGKALRPA
ncbi:MAG TPA: hypothetical protein VHO68_02925, partial [Bacteroidales bacterium]|nr:hypothetical protein [Bacteroidales bacterium]